MFEIVFLVILILSIYFYSQNIYKKTEPSSHIPGSHPKKKKNKTKKATIIPNTTDPVDLSSTEGSLSGPKAKERANILKAQAIKAQEDLLVDTDVDGSIDSSMESLSSSMKESNYISKSEIIDNTKDDSHSNNSEESAQLVHRQFSTATMESNSENDWIQISSKKDVVKEKKPKNPYTEMKDSELTKKQRENKAKNLKLKLQKEELQNIQNQRLKEYRKLQGH
jgi:hypothetical protein